MEAGDCLFIPSGWCVAIRVIMFAWTTLKRVTASNRYHHVDSPRPPGGEPQLNLGTFCLAAVSCWYKFRWRLAGLAPTVIRRG